MLYGGVLYGVLLYRYMVQEYVVYLEFVYLIITPYIYKRSRHKQRDNECCINDLALRIIDNRLLRKS